MLQKSSQWEGVPGDFTPVNNCISREKCESESLPRRIEDQKGFFSLMNTVMNDQMPTQEYGIHHMWSRGDLVSVVKIVVNELPCAFLFPRILFSTFFPRKIKYSEFQFIFCTYNHTELSNSAPEAVSILNFTLYSCTVTRWFQKGCVPGKTLSWGGKFFSSPSLKRLEKSLSRVFFLRLHKKKSSAYY